MLYDLVPLIAPAVLLLAAAFAFTRPGQRPQLVPQLTEAATLVALAAAVGATALAVLQGSGTGPLLGIGEVGLSSRLDAVSATMLVLVAFVGWVVVRYSRSYLDGEARQGAFLGWMMMTLAAVDP